MGIEVEDLQVLLRAMKAASPGDMKKLLILGNVHIFVSMSDLKKLALQEDYPLHGPINGAELTPDSLGAALGFEETFTLDINGKATIQLNLEDEVPHPLLSRFDVIIDAGVIFWCFDPAQALRNVFKMLRPQGVVVHITALTGHFGSGYYNLHPKLFEDFYLSNQSRYLMASYRGKPIENKYLRRIARLFGLDRKVSISNKSGAVYLGESGFNRISLISENKPHGSVIPSRATAVLAFQKGKECIPQSPVIYGA